MSSEDSLGSIAEVSRVRGGRGLLTSIHPCQPANIAEERDTITKTIEVLQKANRVIKRDPE